MQTEVVGYFMDQRLPDLIPNIPLRATGAKDRVAKEGNIIWKVYCLKTAFFRPGDPLI
jgi:hypothetical protein